MLAVNAWDEPAELLQGWVEENGFQHRILLNGSDVLAKYGQRGVPTTLWINRKGRVVDAELEFHGPASLEKKTEKLLKAG